MLQNRTITHKGEPQELSLENLVLVYRWSVTDVHYALSTEKELRKIHRVFGSRELKPL